MNSFNKLLKFSKKKKCYSYFLRYTYIIIYYKTNTIIIILLLYNCHSFNKYILLKSGQWVSSSLQFYRQRNIQPYTNIILYYYISTTNTNHSFKYNFFNQKKFQPFIHQLFGSAINHPLSLYIYSVDSLNQNVQYNLKLYKKLKCRQRE